MPGISEGKITATNATSSLASTSLFTVTTPGIISTQQGAKLVGTGAVGAPAQGQALAISADGNTAIVGGSSDNGNAGAAWIYVRAGTTWSQQGAKLVGTGANANARQGGAVGISADGNTAIVGGSSDNGNAGAAWIFVRSVTTWAQQGPKLVGSGAVGSAYQGRSVAMSADGNTVIVGGYYDNTQVGAAWVFVRNGTTWSQQGSKLSGTGYSSLPHQRRAVAISADGNTALIGGFGDNSGRGATWVFVRSGTTWSQQGAKLVGSGAVGVTIQQGNYLTLSADGNTAMIGGNRDNSDIGANWVFVRSGTTWTQQGSKIVVSGLIGNAYQGNVSLSADGNSAMIGAWNDNSGVGGIWSFKRFGTTWSQVSAKLLGTGATGAVSQGVVALSADGNTAIVSGPSDNSNTGAVWFFTP